MQLSNRRAARGSISVTTARRHFGFVYFTVSRGLLSELHLIMKFTSPFFIHFRDDFMSFFDTSMQPKIMRPHQQNKKTKVKPAWASISQ